MNHVIIVGRIATEIEIAETESGKKKSVISLAVPRNFKNSEGVYETDFFRCVLWNGIAERAGEYCKTGDLVCIRGRLQERTYEKENGEKKHITEVIAETISFVASGLTQRKNENEREER